MTLLGRNIPAIGTKDHGRDQVLTDLASWFPPKEEKKSTCTEGFFCCKTGEVAKAKQLGMTIQGKQSTQHGAEPHLKQSQAALNMSRSSEGMAAVSAITTRNLEQAGFPRANFLDSAKENAK